MEIDWKSQRAQAAPNPCLTPSPTHPPAQPAFPPTRQVRSGYTFKATVLPPVFREDPMVALPPLRLEDIESRGVYSLLMSGHLRPGDVPHAFAAGEALLRAGPNIVVPLRKEPLPPPPPGTWDYDVEPLAKSLRAKEAAAAAAAKTRSAAWRDTTRMVTFPEESHFRSGDGPGDSAGGGFTGWEASDMASDPRGFKSMESSGLASGLGSLRGFGEPGEEPEEEEVNLEGFNVPLREWLTQERTRREVKRRFKRLLLTHRDENSGLPVHEVRTGRQRDGVIT